MSDVLLQSSDNYWPDMMLLDYQVNAHLATISVLLF